MTSVEFQRFAILLASLQLNFVQIQYAGVHGKHNYSHQVSNTQVQF